MRRFVSVLFIFVWSATLLSQNASPTAGARPKDTLPQASAAQSSTSTESNSAKPGSVTINLPGGMTRDQADAILNELRQIRQLLEKQQMTTAAPSTTAPPEKVSMMVGKDWHSTGREDAPVTMVEFIDYQCPFCRRFEADTFPQLKKNFIDTGKVRLVSRDLPLEFHPNAQGAAVAARCAGEQQKFWEMHDEIMQDTATDLGSNAILKYAEKINLDLPSFEACLKSQKHVAAIQRDASDAGSLGITGTPSFVIGKTANDQIEGVRIVGAVPYTIFDSTISSLLKR